MSIETKKPVWTAFAIAALREGIAMKLEDVSVFAAMMADRMTDQWDARFGDGAFMLEGQNECAKCKKPLPEGEAFTPSTDGIKFCSLPCLKASGREE